MNHIPKQIRFTSLIVILSLFGMKQASFAQNPETKLGWKLGAQSYTFNRFTFFEAIDKIDSCGLKYVEAFPGQTLGGGIEGKMDYKMSAETRAEILQKLKEKGIKMVSFGVINVDSDEEWHKLFEFGKAMGIESFTSEPDEKFLPLISKLCDEFKIKVAIHNHPNPSHYWNPDILLSAIKGLSNRIGSCADIGHWVRSGLDPVDCLKKLEGHVLQLHFKDLNEKGKNAHDVHWGTGVSDVDAVIRELKRQHFKGVLSVEYEYNWLNNGPDVAASVKYFRQEVTK